MHRNKLGKAHGVDAELPEKSVEAEFGYPDSRNQPFLMRAQPPPEQPPGVFLSHLQIVGMPHQIEPDVGILLQHAPDQREMKVVAAGYDEMADPARQQYIGIVGDLGGVEIVWMAG